MTDRQAEPIFNAIHDTYDSVRFTREPAERLPVHAKITKGQRVLDAACGTGWATMVAAQAVGDTGRVIGIDIADKLLDVARKKAASAGLSNVEYLVGDAEHLEFDDDSFDAVICASSIFYLSDILQVLREWSRVIKVGGTVAFSSYGASFFKSSFTPFLECLAEYDGQAPPDLRFFERTDTLDKCRELLERAGFKEIVTITEQLGYHLSDTTAYWYEMSSSIIKPRLNRLSPEDLERFKADHLSKVEFLRTGQGIWIDVPTHFSVATKRD